MAERGRRMSESGGGRAGERRHDNLLDDLTALRLKLENLMNQDFKQKPKLTRERFLAMLSETKKEHLENANRLRDEAFRLCERWRHHRASDPVDLRAPRRATRSYDSVHSDSNIAQLSPIFDEAEAEVTRNNDEFEEETLTEANEIMADVQAKYETEEKWLRQRMDQLRKEAGEIEQFKARLERGRKAWENALDQGDYAAGSEDIAVNEQPSDASLSPRGTITDPQHNENVWIHKRIPDEQYYQFEQSAINEEYLVENTPWFSASVFQSSAIMVTSTQHRSGQTELIERTEEEIFTEISTSTILPTEGMNRSVYAVVPRELEETEPRIGIETRSGLHPILFISADKFPDSSLDSIERVQSSPEDHTLELTQSQPEDHTLDSTDHRGVQDPCDAQDHGLDVDMVVNISLAASEIDFFCDCVLREWIVPTLSIEAASVTSSQQYSPPVFMDPSQVLPFRKDLGQSASPRGRLNSLQAGTRRISDTGSLRKLEVGNEFFWQLTSSRQSSDRATMSSTDSRRSSRTMSSDRTWRGRDSSGCNTDQWNEGDGMIMDPGLGGEQSNLLIPHQTSDGLYRAMERLKNEITDYPLKRESGTSRKIDIDQSSSTTLEPEEDSAETLRTTTLLREIPRMGTKDIASAKTSLETVGTNSISSNDHIRKRTLAETVRATQLLRKQLSDIVSIYDREVTYLLMRVEHYRQQWKKEHDETQKQLKELKKNVQKLSRHTDANKGSMSGDDTVQQADVSVRKRRRHKTDPSEKPRLKYYDPDFELPVGRDALSQLHRQVFELHVKLNNDDGEEYDKESANKVAVKILKRLLELGLKIDDTESPVQATASEAKSAQSHQTAGAMQIGSAESSPGSSNGQNNVISGQVSSNVQLNSEQEQRQHRNDVMERPQEFVEVYVDVICRKSYNEEDQQASTVGYIAPHRLAFRVHRESGSNDDVSDQTETDEDEDTEKYDHAGDTIFNQELHKLRPDRNVISVTCERSEIIEASYHQAVDTDPDTFTIHQWTPPDLPRYVSDGEAKPDTFTDQAQPRVSLATRKRGDFRQQIDWTVSPFFASSLDSGISLHPDGEADGRAVVRNAAAQAAAKAHDPAVVEDVKACHVHMHKYDPTGPAEFCRRSRTPKRTQSSPNAVAVGGKDDGFSIRNRFPSPARFIRKPIEKTEVGERVMAMGVMLASFVLAPSQQWQDFAHPFVDDTDRFRQVKKTSSRHSSVSSSILRNEEAIKSFTLPPVRAGRRRDSTAAAGKLAELPAPVDDDGDDDLPWYDTVRKKRDEPANGQRTHRTASEADVYSVKRKKTALRWEDGTWTNL